MKLLSFLFGFLIFNSLFSQEKEYVTEFTFEMESGIVLGSDPLELNQPSDHLFYFGKYKSYFSPFNASMFIFKNWGLGIRVQLNYFSESQFSISEINNDLMNKYGANYFVEEKLGNESNSTYIEYNTSYFIALKHRFQHNKLQVITSFYYGANEIESEFYTNILKEKGGNEIINYNLKRFQKVDEGNSFFKLSTLMPTIQVGYQLNNFLYIHTHFNYSIAFTNFSFVEQLEFQLAEKSVENTFNYTKSTTHYQVGVGLSLNLNKTILKSVR